MKELSLKEVENVSGGIPLPAVLIGYAAGRWAVKEGTKLLVGGGILGGAAYYRERFHRGYFGKD